MSDQEGLIEQLQKRILQLESETSQLKIKVQKQMRRGIIYGLKNKRYQTLDYIGSTELSLEERREVHISDLTAALKIPFYKLICQSLFIFYEIVELEQIEFVDKRDLLDLEKKYQQKYKTIQKSNKADCQKCNQVFKSLKEFVQHREICYQQQDLARL